MAHYRNNLVGMTVLGAALVTAGCATDRQLDAKFDAGWRPSASECAWGGATAKLDAYCAELNASDDSTEALFREFDQKIMALEKRPRTPPATRPATSASSP